jgi:uncharacterized phiE125 gp8 family phage protein
MAIKLYTAPVEEPVTLAEAKLHLRINSSTELDALIQALIIGSTGFAEDFTDRRFVTQTWELYLDCFDGDEIRLPFPPLQSVTSVKYYDTSNVEQTLSSSYYVVDIKAEPGRIVLADTYTWPDTYDRPNAVTIRYVCGYGYHAAVPERVRIAQLMHIEAHHNRDERQMDVLLKASENLLFPYRVMRRV